MRSVLAILLAVSFLFGNLQAAPAAPSFSQTVHLNAASIASVETQFVADNSIFAVISKPVQRNAPPLPKPTPPPLPPVPRLHEGEVDGVMPAPGIPGNAPAHIVFPLRLHLGAIGLSRLLVTARRAQPLPTRGLRSRSNRPRPTANPRTVTVGATPAPTGINHWWSYEEGAVTGIGKYMVNVATGNMVVQSDDIDVPERGIDLAFRRTYNSLSQHDYANTDGSTPSMYGDGWTNTFDAHIANNSQGGISVFDIDGARYDYTPHVGNPNLWDPPAGQFAILFADISYPGYIFWLKKNGTAYAFFLPTQPPASLGYAGRLAAIFGRNVNNYLTFTYYWDNGDSSSPYKLNRIAVTHSDGHALNLYFSNYGTYRLLGSVQRPDGQFVIYAYWANATTLFAVYEIVNNSAQIVQGYGWATGHLLQITTSPRWNASNGLDGGWMSFGYNANGTLQSTAEDGVINPTPADGTMPPTSIQPGFPASMLYRVADFGYTSGMTTLSDTDGHNTIWSYDSIGRVKQTQEYTGSQYLSTTQQWDSSNNLIATTDARGNETDYAYDNNGNTIATALPSITTSAGTFRPTSLYSYDANNNVTAYCNPVFNNPSRNWTTPPAPSDSLCPATTGATLYTWDATSDPNEPFGRLSIAQTPLLYHTTFTYNMSSGGQYGLPTTVTGDNFTEIDGTTQWTPTQSFSYDPYGNLASYNKGNGAWTLSYDTMNNRLTQTLDPDGVHSYKCYYPNGQLKAATSAAQFNIDGICGGHSHIYTYDADGNELTELKHFNNEQSLTNKWYDAAERLVDVAVPYNSADYTNRGDYYNFRWTTRYIYDLGQGTPQLFNNQVSLVGHGNLIKTQEYVADESQIWSPPSKPPQGTPHWQDLRGNSYDARDRSVLKVSWVVGTVRQWTSTYDAAGYSGLLTSSCDPLPVCNTDTYDAANQLKSISFNDGTTPGRTYMYDPDSRVHSVTPSTQFGPEAYTYDADGRLTAKSEGSGGGFTNPSTLNYSYYPNGVRSALSVVSTNLNQTNMLRYIYRTDGALSQELFALGTINTAALGFTYSAAGRKKTRTDIQYGGSQNNYSYAYEFENQPNATGRLASMTLPQGPYGGFEYDPEDERTMSQFGTTSYNVRGEIVVQHSGTPPVTSMSANGFLINTEASPGWSVAPTTSFDAYMGVLGSQLNPDGSGLSYGFDAAGRQNSGTNDFFVGGNENEGTLTRGYDAENHTTSSTYVGWPIPGGGPSSTWSLTFGYQWGPNGHPAQIGSSPNSGSAPNLKGTPVRNRVKNSSPISYESLHWDGDTLLFTTNASGAVDDVKIGLLADYTPLNSGYQNITFWDRDPSGNTVACHNTAGIYPVQFPNWKHQTIKPCGIGPKLSIQDASGLTIGQGGILWSPGPDGYSGGDIIVQGVRAYDPNLASWTTPDTNAGSVHDPMSQKPYAWNRNNSLMYADPSGFSPIEEAIGGEELAQIDTASGATIGGGGMLETALNMSDAERAKDMAAGLPADTLNGTYSEPGAAVAAARRFRFIESTVSVEIGATISCNQARSQCGYYNFTAGLEKFVAPVFGGAATNPVGFWHTHPPGDTSSDLSGHAQNMSDIKFLADKGGYPMDFPFTIYTTIGNNVDAQTYQTSLDEGGAPYCVGTLNGEACSPI